MILVVLGSAVGYEPTAKCSVLVEKMAVVQLIKKFPTLDYHCHHNSPPSAGRYPHQLRSVQTHLYIVFL
jgi:hypothetical protein